MKQSRMEEILRDYTAGKLDAQQANEGEELEAPLPQEETAGDTLQ